VLCIVFCVLFIVNVCALCLVDCFVYIVNIVYLSLLCVVFVYCVRTNVNWLLYMFVYYCLLIIRVG